MDRYICEWERADNPTIGMTEKDACAYWKTHAVAGDCRFALRPNAGIPAELRERWAALYALVSTAKKETPKHRAERDEIKHEWRRWAGAQPDARRPLNVQPEQAESSAA